MCLVGGESLGSEWGMLGSEVEWGKFLRDGMDFGWGLGGSPESWFG